MATRRQSRVKELIRKELSNIIRTEVRDPRLAEVTTITEVSVSQDLRSARAYVSILGSDEEKDETLAGLRAASSFIRHELKKRLTLRYVPFLQYELDRSIETGAGLIELMKKTSEENEDISQP